jgi:hypothetical protein
MKHIKKYNENSYSLSFEEFKSNLKEENSEINNLISKIPIGLLLKAKKDLEKLNINVIIKKIYNFIIGNKNESIENYILTLFGVHSLITLAKWLKDFCGKRLPKYFFMLFGLDEESVEKEEFEIITGFRALSKLVFGVAFVCCLIAKIIWISGGLSVDYTFKVEDKHHTDLVIKTYYGYDNNHIEDDYKQKFDLTSDGDILYKGNKIGYIKDDKLFFYADSDAIITKGIVGLLVRVLSGHTPNEIAESDLYFIEKIGLKEHLSPNRANGLVAMVKKMKTYGIAFQAK